MDLSAALAIYDRVSLNLDKLDRVWQQMQELLPEGPFIDEGSPDQVKYEQLGETWTTLAASLPAIEGWRLEAPVLGYMEIGQVRVDYLDIGEPAGLAVFEANVAAPATEALKYRYKLAHARQRLVRQRAAELVGVVDEILAAVPTGVDEEISEAEAVPRIAAITDAVTEIERLLGDALAGGPRQGDLHRHLHFGEPHDLRDIATLDWPAFRPHVELALYGDDAPVPVEVDDIAVLNTVEIAAVPAKVHWDRLDADGFEKLLVRLLELSGSYVRVSRPMHVNAADQGRDIQAYRRVSDGLLSEREERIIVQAKHRPKVGIGPSDVADLVRGKIPLWEGEPVRGLIIATTGSFTRDAVQWAEDHNFAGNRPHIELWSVSEVESLLRKWPALLAEFGLTD
ncbi:MAG TPA: restriction endonuclease [Actinophytocola sp.]|jgi:hypothetical protein|nr:restriction endonuclease [Actinophytocola sp.]